MGAEMSSSNGAIWLHRKALESWLWGLPAAQFKVAVTILMKANWKPGSLWSGGELIRIDRGELLTSLERLALATRTESVKTVRTTLSNLESAEFLARRAARKGQVISIINYDTYQASPNPTGTDSGTTAARQRHDSGTTRGSLAARIDPSIQDPGIQGSSERRARVYAPGEDPGSVPPPTPEELRLRHLSRAATAYRHLTAQVTELRFDGIPDLPSLSVVPGETWLEDSGLLDAVSRYDAVQLHHAIDVRIAEARAKRTGKFLHPKLLFARGSLAYAVTTSPEAVAREAGKGQPLGAKVEALADELERRGL
jgi:hypothetical protein